jgi:histidinol phosphatase-like PHP family hydrolase
MVSNVDSTAHLGAPQWVNCELHCHTTASHDGLISPKRLLAKCRERGVDVLAVTDHDTIDGALELVSLARANDAKIIVGEERTLANGVHVIGLFLKSALRAETFPELLAEIRSQNALCIVPHPFRPKDGLLAKTPEFRDLALQAGCFLEIHNPKANYKQNLDAQEEMRNHGWRPTVGSDAHYECDLGEAINQLRWTGDLRTTIENGLSGGSLKLLRKPQSETKDAKGRQYAGWYYKWRGPLRLPEFLKPLAKHSYHRWRNFRAKPPVLKELFERE